MIDFSLTEEQHGPEGNGPRIRRRRRCGPTAARYDQGEEFPVDVMKKAFEAGFLTSTIPAEYGGGGLGDLDTVILSEELAWGCAGMYTSMMANSLALTPIILFGTEEQKKRFLVPVTKKMTFASYCLTEREAGSDTTGHQDDGPEERLGVHHQRLEVLHHQRRCRRPVPGLRQRRPGEGAAGDQRLRRSPGHARHLHRQGRGQDGPSGLEHGRDLLRGRPCPGREHAGPGRASASSRP